MKRKLREGFHWHKRSKTGKKQRRGNDNLLKAALNAWFARNGIANDWSFWKGQPSDTRKV